MTESLDASASAIRAALERLFETQREAIVAAAEILATCVQCDGVIHAFGTGHSQALAMEITGRAGGLVPTNLLALRDVVVYGGENAEALTRHIERTPAMANRILELAPIRPQDAFVIASHSGVNGATVEFARLVRERGHPTIAFTSLEHSKAVPSRHPSGMKLFELADVVIDNCAPFGDVAISLEDGLEVCAISSVTVAAAGQLMVTEATAQLLARGYPPPVYRSVNVPGGDEHNDRLEAAYEGRIRRSGL
jgi:uncharacterized phosphosugar-binding protein